MSDKDRDEIYEALGVPSKTPNEEATADGTVQTQKENTQNKEPQTEILELEPSEQFTTLEQKALERGWKPDGVAGKRNKSAEEWMESYSLYKKVDEMNQRLGEKDALMEKVAENLDYLKEQSYQKAKDEFDVQIADLRALADDEIQKYYAGESVHTPDQILQAYDADQQMMRDEYQDKSKQGSKPSAKPSPDDQRKQIMDEMSPTERTFVEKYEKILFSTKASDMAAQQFVIARNQELLQENLSPEKRVETLERELLEYPQFKQQAKEVKVARHSKVESSNRSYTQTSKFSKKNLTAAEKEIYEHFAEVEGIDPDAILDRINSVRQEESSN